MTEDLVKVLELADAHIGWGDCTLENVHKEIRATLAAHRARQESRLPCCGYKNPTMGTFNGCQKCIADCADHLIKTSQEAAGELEEAISIVQSHFMIREHTSEQRSDAYAAKADKAMQTLIQAATRSGEFMADIAKLEAKTGLTVEDALRKLALEDRRKESETNEATKAEEFIQAAINSSPQPLKDLGAFLAEKLDAEDFNFCYQLLLNLATSKERFDVVTAKEIADKVRRAFSMWSDKDGEDSHDYVVLKQCLEWVAYNHKYGLRIVADKKEGE